MIWPSDLGLSSLSLSEEILSAICVGMYIGAIYDLLDLEISYWVVVKSVFCCFNRVSLSWEEADLILSRWSSWSLDPSLIPFRLMGTMLGEIMNFLYQCDDVFPEMNYTTWFDDVPRFFIYQICINLHNLISLKHVLPIVLSLAPVVCFWSWIIGSVWITQKNQFYPRKSWWYHEKVEAIILLLYLHYEK